MHPPGHHFFCELDGHLLRDRKLRVSLGLGSLQNSGVTIEDGTG